MQDLNVIKEIIIENYAKFSFDKDRSPYKTSYNIARVVLENSFKYIALDINSKSNLHSLFENLVNKRLLELKPLIRGVDLKDTRNIKANVESFATWKYYLFNRAQNWNKKYLFIYDNRSDFDKFLEFTNTSSHSGVIENNPELDNFIKEWIGKFFAAQSSPNEWKIKLGKEINVLQYNVGNDEKKAKNTNIDEITPSKIVEPQQPPIQPSSKKHLLPIALVIICVGSILFFLITLNKKTEKEEAPITDSTKIRSGPTIQIQDSTPKTPNETQLPKKDNNSNTKNETTKQPIVNETEVDKKELKPIENPEQDGTSKYIRKGELKNKEGSNKMAILIINNDNSINSNIGQKIATVFLKRNGYDNTTLLLSKEFVTDGLFENIFAGGGIDFSKHKFSDFADYFCLGKQDIKTEQSEVRNDMRKATISLEIKVVKTSNGGEIISFTIPSPYNIGIGSSNQQAIEVATNNIITYLKNYKYEN